MPSLTASFKLGTGSASSLIKSASNLSTQLATYNDDQARITYENSAKTDEDFATYEAYLKGRISTLQSSGSISDATKALQMQQDIVTAQHSNISSNIQRENIQIMAGNATNTDKYNLIVNEYQIAQSIGDESLSQSLMSQAYSLSQTIQSEAQTAQSAAAASVGVKVSDFTEAGKMLVNGLKVNGESGMEGTISAVMKAYGPQLQQMGVILPKNAQPNYFDLMAGVAQAKFQAYKLQYQAYAPYDATSATTAYNNAMNIALGVTTFDIGGKSLNYQELQQAAANPNMFTFDYGTGKYVQSAAEGYQYETFQDPNGNNYQALVPVFSGETKGQVNQTLYLNTNQVKAMQTLGLDFSYNNNQKSSNFMTTGDGVQVKVTAQSPDWLKNLIGVDNTTNMYKDAAGNLEFAGPSTDGTPGGNLYTLMNVNGLHGLYENMPDGSFKLAGGDYGFNQGAAQLLLQSAATAQQNLAAKVAVTNQQTQANINIPTPTPPSPTVKPVNTQTNTVQSANLAGKIQPTVSGNQVQPASGGGTQSIQNAAGNIQSGGTGIKITGVSSGNPGAIKL